MLDATTVKKKAAVLYGLPALVLLAGFWSLGVRFGWTLPLGIQMRFPATARRSGRSDVDVAVGGASTTTPTADPCGVTSPRAPCAFSTGSCSRPHSPSRSAC